MANLITIRNPDPATLIQEQTWLSADVATGATSIIADNPRGFSEGDNIVIGTLFEDACEDSLIAGAVSGRTIPVAALQLPHRRGVPVQSLVYNKARIYRSTTQTGDYTLVTTQNIEFDQPTWIYRDPNGQPTDWYKVTWYNSVTQDETSLEDALPFEANKYSDLDPEILRRDYLMGIQLTDYYGNTIRDATLLRHLVRAREAIETELGFPIGCETVTAERHDYHYQDYVQWGFLMLNKHPVIDIQSLGLQFPENATPMEIPLDWIQLDKNHGQIQLVPAYGSISSMLIGSGVFTPLMSGKTTRIPFAWVVSYRAGFLPGEMPRDLEDVVFKKATCNLTTLVGDNLLGPGVSNTSISMDGISQSTGTVASAMYHLYAARVAQYQQDLAQQLPNLRNKYQGIRMLVC